MRSWKSVAVIAGLFLLISGYAYVKYTAHPSPDTPTQEPSEEELERVRALPYTQWTRTAADQTRSGITVHDAALVHDGFNLYTNDRDEAYLMDMQGKHVHTWKIPGKKRCEDAELLEDGTLAAVCVNEALVLLDADSRITAEYTAPVHHDVSALSDRDLLVLTQDPPVPYNKYKVQFDSIHRLSRSGQLRESWSTFKNIESLRSFHPGSPLDIPRRNRPRIDFFDYYHLNTIDVLPDTELGRKDRRFQSGNLLICSRHLNWIAILHHSSKEVLWTWGPGIIDGPHMPSMLSNGNILVFDNGTLRKWTRLIEVDPVRGKIVWEYKADPPESFFSPWRGSCQRLPNGNTLVTETETGRVFEITSDGKIVWEFWNPEVRRGKRRQIYRMLRVEKELAEKLL